MDQASPQQPPFGEEPTAVLSRRVRPGREEAFRRWAQGFSQEALEFPGCLRCHVVPPLEGVQAEWIFMAAFSDPAALRTWVESPQRARWLKEVEPLVDDTGPMRVISGLEALFGLLPPDQAKPPAVWKLAAVTLTGLYPTLLLSATFLAPRLQGLPLLPRVLLSALATVLVMTWGVMPLMTRMFRPWLYPRR